MPKMKTHSGLKKRLRKTSTGKLKRGSAYTSHLAQNKSTKQKRQARKGSVISPSDFKRIKQQISNL